MAARLRLLLSATVKTFSDSLFGINTTPPSVEYFRFLDLPTEIQCMIYEYLKHDVKIKLLDLSLPGCTKDVGAVEDCFHPSIMLVCQQMRDVYTAVTTPAMRLRLCLGCYDTDDMCKTSDDAEACCPVLPESVLAQITSLDIRVRTGCGGWPHCDYLPSIRILFSRMTTMSQAFFTSSFYFDQLDEDDLDYTTELDNYRLWINSSLSVFPTIMGPSPCCLRVGYEIRCDLFCPLSEDDTEASIPESIFGVCSGPAEDTFKFHNLDLKFLGEAEVVEGRDWWHGA